MRISDVVTAPVMGGFFHDDLAAIRQGVVRDGRTYRGQPVTGGYTAIRMPATAWAIGLRLDGGPVVWGDALTVQYAGVDGRDPVFVPDGKSAGPLREALRGLAVDDFRAALRAAVDAAVDAVPAAGTALRYGLSQALLSAAATAQGTTMCEVLCAQYGLPLIPRPVPIYAQSGDDWRGGADKMILKRADALPHGLVNSEEKFGSDGGRLLEYVTWLAGRIALLGESGYRPTLHFDVYGLAGTAFDGDIRRVADYLARIEQAAAPWPVRVEAPVDLGSREAQVEGMRELRDTLRARGCAVGIVADEWCNSLADIEAFATAGACDLIQVKMPDLGTVEDSLRAVRLCREAGVGTLLGGSCTETELSARVSVHVALAARPDIQLAKPGMGVDEALMITRNEQTRTLAMLTHGHRSTPDSVGAARHQAAAAAPARNP